MQTAPPRSCHRITRGGRFEITIELTQNGAAFDPGANDYTPVMELRTSPSAAASASFTFGVAGSTLTGVLPADDTAALEARNYRARLLLVHGTDATLNRITATRYEFMVENSTTQAP